MAEKSLSQAFPASNVGVRKHKKMKILLTIVLLFNVSICFAEDFDIKTGKINLPDGYKLISSDNKNNNFTYGFTRQNKKRESNTTLALVVYDHTQKRSVIFDFLLERITKVSFQDAMKAMGNKYPQIEFTDPKEISISGAYALESEGIGSIDGTDVFVKVKVTLWNNNTLAFYIFDEILKNQPSVIELDKSIGDISFYNKRKNNEVTSKLVWQYFKDFF